MITARIMENGGNTHINSGLCHVSTIQFRVSLRLNTFDHSACIYHDTQAGFTSEIISKYSLKPMPLICVPVQHIVTVVTLTKPQLSP
jgi:hypothetical protein